MSGWQQIETAPKEVDVLVYLSGAAIPVRVAMLCAISANADEWRWIDTGCNRLDRFSLTHWQPLPEPPNVT